MNNTSAPQDFRNKFLLHNAKAGHCLFWEGKTRSGGWLSLFSDGYTTQISWQDRAGIKEGWLSQKIPSNKLSKERIQKLLSL